MQVMRLSVHDANDILGEHLAGLPAEEGEAV